MRISRIKLVNFIGIKHGLDKNEIEISFPKENDIIMLSGENGSGKSTIMSQLHPFKESFDDRKQLILEGMEGRKEVDIEDEDNLYEITHIYSDSAQSFIKKNGEELNENGGVRTFEEIVSKELGLTKSYFKIGKIGSNTKAFIDQPTAERKNYIGTFLNIEDIIEKYNIAKAKFTAIKKEVASVGAELSNFEEKEILEEKTSKLEEEFKNIEETINTQYSLKGSTESLIQQDKEKISSLNIDTLNSDYYILSNKINELKKIKELYELKNSNIDIKEITKDIETLTAEVSEISGDIKVKNNEIFNTTSLLTDYKNNLTKNRLELKSIGDESDLNAIEEKVKLCEEKEAELKAKIIKNKYTKTVNEIRKERDPERLLEKFKTFVDFIELYFPALKEKDINKDRMNIDLFLNEDFQTIVSQNKQIVKDALKSKNDLLKSKENEISKLSGFLSQLENLKKRPAACSINDCPFIKEAYEHRNDEKEIEKIQNELPKIKAEIESFETKLDNLVELETLFKSFQINYNAVLPRENKFLFTFLEEKSLIEWVEGGLSTFSAERQKFYDECFNACDLISEYLLNHGQLKNYKETRDSLKNTDNSIKEKYTKNIEELEEKISSSEEKLISLKNEKEVLDKTLTTKNEELSEKSKYIEAHDSLETYQIEEKNLLSNIALFNSVSDEITKLSDELYKINSIISSSISNKTNIQNEINNNKIKIGQIDILREKLEKLKADYEPIENIMNALSPTSGIPLILIQLYLEKTQKIANDLLKIAYNGDFEIQFETNAKDFFIKVMAKENIKADIKLASQGEVALTTLSISLALIEQSVGKYNILCLDEIDGPLDANNRENFISILTKQIKEIGIEQVFVISHNNAFDLCKMGLILLKNSSVNTDNEEFMKNKNIIYQYKENNE